MSILLSAGNIFKADEHAGQKWLVKNVKEFDKFFTKYCRRTVEDVKSLEEMKVFANFFTNCRTLERKGEIMQELARKDEEMQELARKDEEMQELARKDEEMQELAQEVKEHLCTRLIPFWENLKDEVYGGYYGYVDYALKLDKTAGKGCILNSRILWFFSNTYRVLGEKELLGYAGHGFAFMKNHCIDRKYGGVFWSLDYQGNPKDTTKHTYNQAFSIYALSSYYEASGEEEALRMAKELFHLIETKCCDENGYLESFDRSFLPEENDKLSENGVIADRTMNTLLHVFEAYTELYRVSKDIQVKERLEWILDTFAEKIYNPALHRQEVFFDKDYNSLLDLHSYGHDIETAWLLDRGVEILEEPEYEAKISPITRALTEEIYQTAFDGHSLSAECEKGVTRKNRIWWVQAETLIGFINGYQKDNSRTDYLKAAKSQWQFIKDYVIDKRQNSEWFWEVNPDGTPIKDRPIVEPWKCPYHNGRMCLEIIKRARSL